METQCMSEKRGVCVCVRARGTYKNGWQLALILALTVTLLELKQPLMARCRHKSLAIAACWLFLTAAGAK